MRWLRRAQAVNLGQRRCQLATQRCYHRAQLVVDLGQQLAFKRGVAFRALLREDFIAFGALLREGGVEFKVKSPAVRRIQDGTCPRFDPQQTSGVQCHRIVARLPLVGAELRRARDTHIGRAYFNAPAPACDTTSS